MALDGTTAILETHLLPKEELYKRWFGATHEEIAGHFSNEELRAYERYKGPINGIIWCKPGHVYYQSQVSYSNPDLYDYNDDSCDYFLIKDVLRCEIEHPEYIGNVTPESLGLVQDETSGAPEEEPEYIKAESLRKEMGLSPVQFVDYLRVNQDLVFFGNGVNDDSRNWFYQIASREQASDMLGDMYIHLLDITAHEKRIAEATSIPPFPVADCPAPPMANIPFPTVVVDASGLESQLAEAQTQNGSLRQWNKRLNEQNQELRAGLTEKDARIAELEALPPAAEPTTTVNAAKWGNSVTAAFGVWADIIAGGKANWKEDEFRAALAERCNDYHTDVHAIAWRPLPDSFKHGRGRPKKNPDKSQQSDNS